jgi:tRNA-uridine 2-sulfurtransferase
MSRILVAMSGGVDSSVAAALLVEAGHDVVGVTMKTYCYSETPSHSKTCCGLDGILDAKRVAAALDIPHYVFDVEEDFTRDVIDDFVQEYAVGRTPNPCVNCNSKTKFKELLARGRALDCDQIASGHYVRVRHSDGGSALLRGLDPDKDQSYFLWAMPKEILPKLLFPLGDLTKTEVRAQARALELITADKPESQEICFVPTGDYRDLLKKRLGDVHPALEPGPLVRRDGSVVGEHGGYAGFTVGQRKGLGGGFPESLFVLEVRPTTREVVIGTRDELFEDTVEISQLNWLAAAPLVGSSVVVQLRYRSEAVPAVVSRLDESLVLALEAPEAAISPGQSAVLFDADARVIGGGRIARGYTRASI